MICDIEKLGQGTTLQYFTVATSMTCIAACSVHGIDFNLIYFSLPFDNDTLA